MIKKKVKNNILFKKIVSSPEKRVAIFREIPSDNQKFIFLNLSKYLQKEIINKLNNQEVINLIRYFDPDEVTDLLQNINSNRRKKILEKLNEDIKEKVEFLLKFNPKTAAGMMSLDYIEADKELTFEKLSRLIKKHEKITGKFPAILVIEDGFLLGELPGYVLALHKGKEKIKKSIKKVPNIKYNKGENEIIREFKKHPHDKIIVLDEDDSILGVIYSDDILKLIEKHSLNNLRSFAGVSKEEDVLDSAFVKVKNRYKWLILNLITAFLAASVVGLFQKTISAFVLLAVYMPIVAGMGGNAGTQTLAVVIRGLSLGEIEPKVVKKVILNEMLAGGVNGIIIGIIVSIVASFFNQNPLLGLIVGISMIFNLTIAGFFGSIIPLIMKSLGKDPATSATVFITTATDILGFFVFLGLAALIL